MDGVIVLDTEKCGLADNKTKGEKMTKGSTIGSAARKKLADISNLQQQPQPKPSNQNVNPHQNISLTTKEYIDKLHKENMMLMKVLADRNKIIELSGIELQKLRINFQKVQQQNLQLAQANSQMLAEINSGKDRLKALQHELGCRNGLLKARKLEEKAKTMTCPVSGNEVGTTNCNEAGESLQADKGDNEPCNTNRRRQSKNLILGPSTVKPVQAKEKVDNKRKRQSARFKSEEPEPTEDLLEIDESKNQNLGPSTVKPIQAKEKVDTKRRRQSARFKSEEPEPTEDLFEIDESKNQNLGPSTVEPVQTKEKVDNKRRRQSARFKSEEPEPTEDLFEIDESKNQNLGPSTVKPVQSKEKVDNKRRRQSARFKSEEPEPTEDLFEIDESKNQNLGPSTVKPDQAKGKVDNKRRRQSARFKSEVPEPMEDLFEIDDANFPVSLCDELAHDNGSTSLNFSVQKENEKASVPRDEAQEFRRTSVGRPLRRAAEKVQSYKEIPVNLKMRREEESTLNDIKAVVIPAEIF